MTISRPAAYADDTSGASSNMVGADRCADEFSKVTAAAGLSLNPAKTQMIVLGRPLSDQCMTVNGTPVKASSSISFLGIELDCALSTTPYLEKLIVECRRRVGILRLIESRIGRSNLETVVHGLLYGKLSYLLVHCLVVRVDEAEQVSGRARKLQVVVNDALRMVAGVRRADRVKLTDLRQDVKLPTVNYVVAREAATAAWWALASPNGSPLSSIMEELKPDLRTRGASHGLYRMPKDSRNTFVGNMVRVWNAFPGLAAAKTLAGARSYIRTKIKNALPV